MHDGVINYLLPLHKHAHTCADKHIHTQAPAHRHREASSYPDGDPAQLQLQQGLRL